MAVKSADISILSNCVPKYSLSLKKCNLSTTRHRLAFCLIILHIPCHIWPFSEQFFKKMYVGVYSPDTCQNVSPLRHVYGLIYFLTAMAVCFASSYNFLSYNTTKAVPHHKKRVMNYQKSTALNIPIYLPLLSFLLLGKFSQTFISICIHIVPIIRQQVAAG